MKNSNDALIRYCHEHSSGLSAEQESVFRQTQLYAYNPDMCSSLIQGKFLRTLSIMKAPKHILEIGSFTGFSGLCLADGLRSDGILTTIEYDEENYSLTKKHIDASVSKDKINCLFGDALEIIPTLDGPFDLVFIDAAKKHYADFYNLVMDKMESGGMIIVDNVLWFEKVLMEKKDPTTQAIHDFNQHVINDDRVEHILLPFEDGNQIIVKK